MKFELLTQLKKEGVLIKEQKAQDQKQGQGELPVSGSQKDRSKKYLEAYPDVFADIVNVLILGEKTIASVKSIYP